MKFGSGACLLALLILNGGCQRGREVELTSRDPVLRARAAIDVSEQSDASYIPHLVNLLDDDDPGVRFYAIVSLRRLTGEDYGYHYYDPPADRAIAVTRWREAIRNGTSFAHEPIDGSEAPKKSTSDDSGRAMAEGKLVP